MRRAHSKAWIKIVVGLVMIVIVIGGIGTIVYQSTVKPLARIDSSKTMSLSPSQLTVALNGVLTRHFNYLKPTYPAPITTVGYVVPGYKFQVALPISASLAY